MARMTSQVRTLEAKRTWKRGPHFPSRKVLSREVLTEQDLTIRNGADSANSGLLHVVDLKPAVAGRQVDTGS